MASSMDTMPWLVWLVELAPFAVLLAAGAVGVAGGLVFSYPLAGYVVSRRVARRLSRAAGVLLLAYAALYAAALLTLGWLAALAVLATLPPVTILSLRRVAERLALVEDLSTPPGESLEVIRVGLIERLSALLAVSASLLVLTAAPSLGVLGVLPAGLAATGLALGWVTLRHPEAYYAEGVSRKTARLAATAVPLLAAVEALLVYAALALDPLLAALLPVPGTALVALLYASAADEGGE